MLRWTDAKVPSGHQQERIHKGGVPGENISVEGRREFSNQGREERKQLGMKTEV